MKKLYFLIALFACLELAIAPAKLQAAPQDVDESIEALGDELGEALEELARSFGESAEQFGKHVEKWAEQHAGELEGWSEKYAQKWEVWADGMQRQMERFAQDQEGAWGKWAQQYEANWDRWAAELENEEVSPEIIGQLVERNLEALSEMPLGEMVDRLVKEGLGELHKAPWESLDELGALAKSALNETSSEFAEMAEEGSPERRQVEKNLEDLQRAMSRIGDEVEQRVASELTERQLQNRETVAEPGLTESHKIRAQIRGIERLLSREDLTAPQRERLSQALATLNDAAAMLEAEGRNEPKPRGERPREVQQKKAADKRPQDQSLKAFNEDLRRSSEESRKVQQRVRELDARQPKRVDGKNMDAESKRAADGQAVEAAAEARSRQDDEVLDQAKQKMELELLRKEVEALRKELQQLKKSGGK